VASQIPYAYDYIIKLCRTQAELTLNHANPNVHGIGQEEARHRKYERLTYITDRQRKIQNKKPEAVEVKNRMQRTAGALAKLHTRRWPVGPKHVVREERSAFQ
jgi:primosomal protein N''